MISIQNKKKNSLRFRKWKDVLKLYLNSLKKKEAEEIEDNKVNNREEERFVLLRECYRRGSSSECENKIWSSKLINQETEKEVVDQLQN